MAKRNDKQPNGQRDRAVDLLLEGRSIPDVAGELGVRRETVWRWTQDPEVAAELRARRMERREAKASQLDELADRALEVLSELLEGEDTPPAVRFKIATALLDRAGLTDKAAVEQAERDRSRERDPMFGL